ncbi:MAG: M28 family peptidase [Bacteroidales bacterium]
MKTLIKSVLYVVLLSACTLQNREAVNVDNLKRVVKEISDDSFMGRKPFTQGEELSVEYLANELKNIGFEPAFNGSYFQQVPMIQITSCVNGDVALKFNDGVMKLNAPDQIAVNSPLPLENVKIESSQLVFCGFGIVSPEYNWNDFKGIDLKGKTAVVLINDPGLYTMDKSLFKGTEMTYYGRWTYKYEQAAKMGAAGVLIIHEERGAGYGFNVPRNSSISSKLFIDNDDINNNSLFTGWLTAESANEIFLRSGLDLEELKKSALTRDFKPVELNANVSLSFTNTIERASSKNVAGILKGAVKPDETVIMTAHWDHFGVGEKQDGDSIYNGAVDNGTTMAWALETGRIISKMKRRPDRSLIILFPTAEEQGLTGSYYYVANPVIPMNKTIACLNNDMLVPNGRMKDVTMIGYGYSTLDSLYNKLASEQERYLLPDPDSHTGLFFRSDHHPFFKAGVPSIWAMGCFDSRENGAVWARERWDHFIKNVYHRPADNYNPEWDWSGVVEDTELAVNAVIWLTNTKNPKPVMK